MTALLPLLALTLTAETAELPRTASAGPLALRAVTCDRERVGRFEPVELRCDLTGTWDNPFDPADVDVTATLTPPDGEPVTVPGFFYQPYRPRPGDPDGTPLLDADGEPDWRVRFTPTSLGVWHYRVHVRDRSGAVTSDDGQVTVLDSDRPGFVRVSRVDPRRFACDDGSPYLVIGQNVQNDWPTYRHTRLLAEAGGNAVRAWTFCHWTWLEWSHRPASWAGPGHWMWSYAGAGQYNQRIAWIADRYLARCGEDGLRVMLCLGNGSELGEPEQFGSWGGHPYNRANGGPLATGGEFWTSEAARRLYRQRLRYLVARYSASPTVWAWELWNETGKETDEQVAWLGEMSGYLKQIDPHRHLVTTSHWGTNAEASPRTWALPGIDFTQTHNYSGPETIRARTRTMLALSPKPHIIGEGGGPGPWSDRANDPDGVDLHNCLWAAVANGAAGGTLPWWWRERIEPKQLFGEYTTAAKLLARVPWEAAVWSPLAPGRVTVTAPAGGAGYGPLLVTPLGPGWGQRSPGNRFEVSPDGSFGDAAQFAPVLYSAGRREWRNPPEVTVTCPAGGKLVVRVGEVSHGVLVLTLDGTEVVRDASFDVDRTGVNRDVTVELTPGRHVIGLDNAGSDWLRISYLLLLGARDTARYPDLEVDGLGSEGGLLLWLHHRLHAWSYLSVGLTPTPVAGATVTVTGLADGPWRAEWWDTRTGEVTGTTSVRAAGGQAELPPPPVATDLAVFLRPGTGD